MLKKEFFASEMSCRQDERIPIEIQHKQSERLQIKEAYFFSRVKLNALKTGLDLFHNKFFFVTASNQLGHGLFIVNFRIVQKNSTLSRSRATRSIFCKFSVVL